MDTPARTVLLVGEPDDGAEERLHDLGYATARVGPVTTRQVAGLLSWVCTDAHAVYMGPGWRTNTTYRAVRAAAIAAGTRVLGFE